MGCDIHTMAEVKGKRTYLETEEVWHSVKKPVFDNDYFYADQMIDALPKYGMNVPYTKRPYQGRNYRLFSILANVRNSGGNHVNIFVPPMVETRRDSLLPIAQPRGVPEDASKHWVKYQNADIHSSSYFTLTELIKARADGAFKQPVMERGYVAIETYRSLVRDGTEPETWAGWSSNGISENEYLTMSDAEQRAFKGSVATEWVSIVDETSNADNIIRRLTSIAPREGEREWGQPDNRTILTDKVRMVFGFDN